MSYNKMYSMAVCQGLTRYDTAHFENWMRESVIPGKKIHYYPDYRPVPEKDRLLFGKVILEFIKGHLILSSGATQMEVQELRDALRRASAIFFSQKDPEAICRSVSMILHPATNEGFKKSILDSLVGHVHDDFSPGRVSRMAEYFAEFCGGSKDILAAFAEKYYESTRRNSEFTRDRD